MSLISFKPKLEILKDLIIDEYIGTGEDRVKNREGFTDMLADVLFNIPAIRTANSHRGVSTSNTVQIYLPGSA